MSGFCGKCAASFIFFFVLSLSSPVAGYEWNAVGGLQGWKTHNVLSSRLTETGIIVYGVPNSSDFGILSPEGIFSDGSHVRIRLRTMSIGSSVRCEFFSRGTSITKQRLPIYGGKAWKEYAFELYDSKDMNVPIDAIALDFADAEYVEIRDVTIKGPSFSEFFIAQGANPFNVNALYPFRLYGYPATLLFYAIAALSGFGIAVYCVINKKRAFLAMACVPLLALYFVHDMREDYEELIIMKTQYEDYLDASPADKRFFWNDALVGFSDFIRRNAGAGDKAVNFYGNDNDYLYLKYLLYPMKFERGTGKDSLVDVNVFCGVRKVSLDGSKLLHDGHVIFDGGRGLAFNSVYFLYMIR